MFDKVEKFTAELESLKVQTKEELEQFRIKFISKKSVVTELFNDFKNVPNEQKKQFGAALNELKTAAKSPAC